MDKEPSLIARSGRHIFLLGSLLGLLIASAFFEDGKGLFNALLSITLLSSVYAISHDKRFLVTGLIIAIATFLCAWLEQMLALQALGLVSSFLGFVFFQFTAAIILLHIFRAPTITIDELLGAISTYLLLGIGGGFIFQFLEILDPDTLLGSADVVVELTADSPMNLFIYYSFTCLTTLGFGDLIPGTPEARVFSFLSAVIGQMFLTVLIARFVGLHISQLRRD